MRELIGPFSQIITMANLPDRGPINDENLDIIEDGGIVVENEKILEIGIFSQLNKNTSSIREINFPCVIVPGFIDSHTHVCHFGNRSD